MHDPELVRTRHQDLLDDVRGRRPTRTEARPRNGRRVWRRWSAR